MTPFYLDPYLLMLVVQAFALGQVLFSPPEDDLLGPATTPPALGGY
jgi:hypothetical protein